MKHFLDLADWSRADLQAMLDYAVALKKEYKSGGNDPILAGKSLALVFQKPSLRTRVSFEMGMVHLGGYAFYLSPQEIGLGKRESIADIARVLGGYCNGVMARVFDHQHVLDLARWSPVPIINGLSDYNHPCQGMADLLTIYEEYGKLEGLKLTYVGDSNNVANTLITGAAMFNMKVAVASPKGYQPKQSVIDQARQLNGNFEITVTTDPAEAVRGADVIYTDTWTSMGQEEEAEQRRKIFPPYQVNDALLGKASSDVIVMHCLPAHRGEEITDEVADGPHSRLFPQAENRLHAQKAILVYLLAPEAFEKWQSKQEKKAKKK